jgi:hypothetical protein
VARFIFLTKTRWDEPPRIRHQLAYLLASAGHEVLFFEKPAMSGRSPSPPVAVAKGIECACHRELIHHKLRLMPLLHRINATFVRRSLRKVLHASDFARDAVIVNFNYDYYFVRQHFPHQRLITVINDDFVATALFGFKWSLRWALKRTCASSDHVVTVSAPIQRQLESYCTPELFLPWADQTYVAPAATRRDRLLFWGFINKKLDFPRIAALADELATERPGVRLMIVGPVEQGAENELAVLATRMNIEILPATSLDKLPLDQVLASLIPYRTNMPDVEAITLPNKALQLLARGLPLLISGMPYFVQKPFVFNLDTMRIATVVDQVAEQFNALQPEMQAFVAENSADSRLRQFMRWVA